MKKIFIFLLVFSALIMFAEEGFVISRVAPMLDEGQFGSPRIGILRQGDQVEILETDGEWLKVTDGENTGYVQAVFIGAEPSVAAAQDTRGEAPAINVRKRASSYTSSAAAARGLASESVRDRANVAFKNYDFETLDWLEENFSYSEDELIEFALDQKLFL